MIMMLFLLLLSIWADIVISKFVSKKVSNKFLRYLIIFIFSTITICILWIIIVAFKSGEM